MKTKQKLFAVFFLMLLSAAAWNRKRRPRASFFGSSNSGAKRSRRKIYLTFDFRKPSIKNVINKNLC